MSFFFKNKLKVQTRNDEGRIKFYIDFYKVKNSAEIKLHLLKELIDKNHCLAAVSTDMMYQQDISDLDDMIDNLIAQLEKLNITFIKKSIVSQNTVKVLGILLNSKAKKKRKDYMIGFIARPENLEALQNLTNKFTLHYYIGIKDISHEELLNKFQENYSNEDELSSNFDYEVIDNSYLERLAISSTSEGSGLVSNIIDKSNQNTD